MSGSTDMLSSRAGIFDEIGSGSVLGPILKPVLKSVQGESG